MKDCKTIFNSGDVSTLFVECNPENNHSARVAKLSEVAKWMFTNIDGMDEYYRFMSNPTRPDPDSDFDKIDWKSIADQFNVKKEIGMGFCTLKSTMLDILCLAIHVSSYLYAVRGWHDAYSMDSTKINNKLADAIANSADPTEQVERTAHPMFHCVRMVNEIKCAKDTLMNSLYPLVIDVLTNITGDTKIIEKAEKAIGMYDGQLNMFQQLINLSITTQAIFSTNKNKESEVAENAN